jgi:hypothetical protein
LLLASGSVRISLVVFFPVNRFAVHPNLFFVVLEWWWCRRGDRRLLPKDITKALKMQFANPVFHWQFPLLLGIGPVANQCIRPKTQTLGHGNIVLLEPAELLGPRPIVPLWFLGHPKRKRNAYPILKRDIVVGNSLIGTRFVTCTRRWLGPGCAARHGDRLGPALLTAVATPSAQ